jgi:streptogramin lyase
MRSLVPKLLIASLAPLAALVWVPGAVAAPAVTGTFKVPRVGTNNKDVAGPDGNIWVTLGGNEENVARVSPAGEVKEFELGLEGTTGIAVGPEGKLWVTAKKAVAVFDPKNPEGVVATEITAVESESSAIVTGPEHKMWVATGGKVLRFLPTMPAVQEEVPIAGLSPRDIDSVGSVVAVADAGEPRIITFTTAFKPAEIKYGAMGASQGLAIAPTGQIGFSDPGANPEQIGLVAPPATAQLQEQIGEPFDVAYGEDGAFWFAQFNDGEAVRLSASGQKTFVGGLPKMSARQITTGPDHTLWVTLVAAGEEGVARISGVEPPSVVTPAPPVAPAPPAPAPVPNTLFSKAPQKLIKITGAKPVFAGCTSPRVLHLGPGKYRFAVRAVAGGVTDASPAESAFTVVRRQQRPKHR